MKHTIISKTCSSLDELIAEQVKNARSYIDKSHYFKAHVYYEPGKDLIIIYISHADSFLDYAIAFLDLNKLPTGMTFEQAIDKIAEALSSVDRRTVIVREASYSVIVKFSDDEFKKICLQYYLSVPAEKIYSMIEYQLSHNRPKGKGEVIPQSIEVRTKEIVFHWQPDFFIDYTTGDKFGPFKSAQKTPNASAICYVINDYFNGKYRFRNNNDTTLELKDEFDPIKKAMRG